MSWDAEPPPATEDGLATLIEAIQQHCLRLLAITPEGVTEYTLISQLNKLGVPPYASEQGQDNLLSLFQKHFLLFHALYRLREHLPAGQDLHIHCLDIRLTQRPTRTDTLPGEHDALASYYLDLAPLYHTDANAVDALLRQGYARLVRHQHVNHAYATLALKPGSSLADIKKTYRQLAMRHHPDRGGNNEHFMEINLAFDILVASLEDHTHA